MRYCRAGGFVIAEKVRSGKRYSLKPWQYELLAQFDGKRTFEEAAKEVYGRRPGAFTAVGLLNFYNWLYTEDLVVCECQSIFELVSADLEEGEGDDEEDENEGGPKSGFIDQILRHSGARRALAITAAAVFCLSVVRLVKVASPVFEPPVAWVAAQMEGWGEGPQPSISLASAERSAVEPEVTEVAPAAQLPLPDSDLIPVDPVAPAASAPVLTNPAESDLLPQIEALRVQLEECRIRRDEFYLQNDEEGYRREVHRMTNLVREIGDIEKSR